MEKDENKIIGKNTEEENKSFGKEEKTLLKTGEGENNVSDVSENNGSESGEKNKNEGLGEEEAEDIEGDDSPPNGEEDLDFDIDELDDIPEGDDPFADFLGDDEDEDEEPRKKRVEDLADKMTSEKNSDFLNKVVLKSLGKVDVLKAKICEKISGDHFVGYLGDEETIELFLEAFKIWAAEKEIKEPSPFVTMLTMLAFWTLPPLGMALLSRFDLGFFDKKETLKVEYKKTFNNHSQENKTEGEQASDSPPKYAHLKEFQQQRKKFSLNASGFYNHTPNGKDYIAVEYADELPSDIVNEWIKEGKKNREIIKLLGYG